MYIPSKIIILNLLFIKLRNPFTEIYIMYKLPNYLISSLIYRNYGEKKIKKIKQDFR
jgi:hypothetical protein